MNQMTNEFINPWINMHVSSTRRIDFHSQFNFYWISDDNSRYCFLIKFESKLISTELDHKIKGINTIFRVVETGGSELYLVLRSNKEWEIFHSLCKDLLDSSKKCNDEEMLARMIDKRLKQWQHFLSLDQSNSLSEPIQMGLYSELSYMVNYLVPNLGLKASIISWTGPESGKQDFSLIEHSIEVKSYITTKGPIVKISSIYQMMTDFKNLYLVAFALSHSDNSLSILDLIHEVYELLEHESLELAELFTKKILQYGYFEGITQKPFFKYSVDDISCYGITDKFPRIVPSMVQHQIIDIEYSIDLSKCNEFKMPLEHNSKNI